jgi:hypothetical protein
MLFNLGHNLGYSVNGMCSFSSEKGFSEKQARAWENTKYALARGLPCYGWELEIPEYYVINGWDDVGYYFSGPGTGATGPKPWQELGVSDIGMLELYWVEPAEKAADEVVVKEALEFALEHAGASSKWVYPGYSSGLAAYDIWIKGAAAGTASPMGMAYNAQVWAECRNEAVEFLEEARNRLSPGVAPLIDTALGYYRDVAAYMRQLSMMYPFPHARDTEETARDGEGTVRTAGNTAAETVRFLTIVRDAEAKGLDALQDIVAALA